MEDSPWQEHKILGIKSWSRNVKRFTNHYPNDALSIQMKTIHWIVGRQNGRIYERDRIWSRIWKMWKIRSITPKIQATADLIALYSMQRILMVCPLPVVLREGGIEGVRKGGREGGNKPMLFCDLLSINSFTHCLPWDNKTNRWLTLGFHNPMFAMTHVIIAFSAVLCMPLKDFFSQMNSQNMNKKLNKSHFVEGLWELGAGSWALSLLKLQGI